MRQTFQERHLAVRLVVYFVGLFIMTLGVSMSVKSNLGVSPVSSIPYTITCIFGLEMGKSDHSISYISGHSANHYFTKKI